jgi:hypothetical protein
MTANEMRKLQARVMAASELYASALRALADALDRDAKGIEEAMREQAKREAETGSVN